MDVFFWFQFNSIHTLVICMYGKSVVKRQQNQGVQCKYDDYVYVCVCTLCDDGSGCGDYDGVMLCIHWVFFHYM